MRLGSIVVDGAPRAVQLRDSESSDLLAPIALETLVRGGGDPGFGIDTVAIPKGRRAQLAAPLRPGKVVAIGLNYFDHVRETGMTAPERPLVFSKFTTGVVGPGAAIEIDPELTERVDWEVELAVVMGRTARRVSESRALDYVYGYTVGNDVSARDVQFADGQWVRGKSFDTFCPLGPVVVTRDELPDPQALGLRTRINGELVQDSSTAEMIFSVASVIAFCSHSFTLEPGDVILTGTPWGCGEFMEPKRWLSAGDVVECEIDGIGTLRNPVVITERDTR